jgi:hypothetical protein
MTGPVPWKTHLPALALILLMVGVVALGWPWPEPAADGFDAQGRPVHWTWPPAMIGAAVILWLVLFALDGVWALVEGSRKRFNPLSLLDEGLIGWMLVRVADAGVANGFSPALRAWAWAAGGLALAAAAALEARRQTAAPSPSGTAAEDVSPRGLLLAAVASSHHVEIVSLSPRGAPSVSGDEGSATPADPLGPVEPKSIAATQAVRLALAFALGLASPACGGGGDGGTTPTPQPTASAGSPYPQAPLLANGLRNKYKWPFASDSIWNMPIGAGARYVPAGIAVATAMGMTVDEDVIVQRADAPLQPVVVNDAGWDSGKTRCGSLQPGHLVYPDGVPVPADFTTDPGYLGTTPNMSAAILMPDGQTVCGRGGTVTSQYRFPDENIGIGAGIAGAHGASGMSSIGGTVRVGELVPGGVIRHALKVNVFGRKNYHFDAREATPGYRWPAKSADGYAGDPKSSCAYGGGVPAMRIGSLVALKPDFSIEALRSEPARILARALMDYGAYTVDDTCWDVYGLTTLVGEESHEARGNTRSPLSESAA